METRRPSLRAAGSLGSATHPFPEEKQTNRLSFRAAYCLGSATRPFPDEKRADRPRRVVLPNSHVLSDKSRNARVAVVVLPNERKGRYSSRKKLRWHRALSQNHNSELFLLKRRMGKEKSYNFVCVPSQKNGGAHDPIKHQAQKSTQKPT